MADQQDRPKPVLVDYNEDGTLTKETLKRAMKAIRKRLKLTRLDEVSRLGHDPLSKGEKSSICAVQPPRQYPTEVWERLVELGRLKKLGENLYEIVEVS